MRLASPAILLDDIWGFLLADATTALSIGKLIADSVTELRLAELDPANLPTDIAAIPTTAMRGTDSAALAAEYTAARAALIDNVGQLGLISASETLLLSSDAEVTHTGDTTLTKVKEFVVTVPGTYRITAELKQSVDVSSAQYQVNINGSPVGVLHPTVSDHTVYQEFSDDLEVVPNDLVQAFIKVTIGSRTAFLRNFRLKGDLGVGVGVERSV